jgi:hypothetical protein
MGGMQRMLAHSLRSGRAHEPQPMRHPQNRHHGTRAADPSTDGSGLLAFFVTTDCLSRAASWPIIAIKTGLGRTRLQPRRKEETLVATLPRRGPILGLSYFDGVQTYFPLLLM